MRELRHRTARGLRRNQSGFTLVEVLVVVSLLAIVLGAAFSMLDTGSKVARKDIERAHAIEEVENGVARMDRELRTATQVFSPVAGSGNLIDFEARVRPPGGGTRVLRRVAYQCSVVSPTDPTHRACLRYEGPPGSTPGGAGQLVVDHVVNGTPTAPVFTTNGASPPTYVSIQLRRSAAGALKDGYDYAIRVEHGVHLRNVSGSL